MPKTHTPSIPLPPGAEKWNRALVGAFRKGCLARLSGSPLDACPYADTRKTNGGLTWSRAYRTAWDDGWRWADQNAKEFWLCATSSRNQPSFARDGRLDKGYFSC